MGLFGLEGLRLCTGSVEIRGWDFEAVKTEYHFHLEDLKDMLQILCSHLFRNVYSVNYQRLCSAHRSIFLWPPVGYPVRLLNIIRHGIRPTLHRGSSSGFNYYHAHNTSCSHVRAGLEVGQPLEHYNTEAKVWKH